MTALEAKRELMQTGDSKADLLKTDDLTKIPGGDVYEEPVPLAASPVKGDTDSELSFTYGHRQLLDEPLINGNVTQRFKVVRDQEGAGDNITIDVKEFVLKQDRR